MKQSRVAPLPTVPRPSSAIKLKSKRPPLHKPNPLTVNSTPPVLTPSTTPPQPHMSVISIDSQVHVGDYKYHEVWKRALFKIKVRAALKTINEELLVFGTTNELTDMNQQYKENIDELIERKVKKREMFRSDTTLTESAEHYSWLIHPDAPFKKVWNLLLALLMLYTALIMPYRLAFSQQIFWDGWTCVDVSIDGLFFIDIFINFFSITIKDDGTMETSRSRIICSYIKSWLIVDLVSCFPMTLVDFFSGSSGSVMPQGKYNNLVRLARLPRLYKLLRIVRILKLVKHYSNSPMFLRLQDCLQINSRNFHSGLYKLTKFLVSVFMCVHIFGCMWYFSARITDFDIDTWVVRIGVQDSSDLHKYLLSIYWAITTAATVGYGDIVPYTQLELVFAVLWMVVGVGFYSFTVGSLSSFLTSIDTRDSVLSMKLAAVAEFAKETGISQESKVKIREAVKYNAYRMGNVWSDKHSLFKELPKALRHEVVLSMYNGAAKDFPIFSLFEASFLTAMLPLMRPMRLTDGEYIYHQGDYADEVFFILHGRVNFVLQPSEIAYKSFLRGSYVGEIEIFKRVNRMNSATCFGHCEFLVLAKNDLLQVLAEFPAEAKEFRRIAFERANRNKQAYLETLELLKMKAAFGSLNELAGQDRILNVETEVDTELPAVEQFREKLRDLLDEVKSSNSGVQELADLVINTQRLLGDILRRTEGLPYEDKDGVVEESTEEEDRVTQ